MSEFDWSFPYPSRRMPVLAANVVCTSQPLAAQAGLRMMAQGGNAIDAAIAAAIALTVVEPVMNGIGSDAFALVWDHGKLQGLNASGRAPRAWSAARFAGYGSMPTEGWDSVTVPGAVSAWAALSERFGRLPFAALFEPAIAYASRGFLVSPTVARQWQAQLPRLAGQPGFAAAFLPGGRAPLPGELFRFPEQAETLREIAASRGEAFYRGRLAQAIAAFSAACGGALDLQDMQSHRCEWVEPVTQDYRGHQVHELPPNGQGIAALMALGMLGHFDLASLPPDSCDSLHLQIEAMKLAFADVYRHVADPETMEVSPGGLLAPSYLESRAGLITIDQARHPRYGMPPSSGTVYLATADSDGMMVSFIQSNYRGFGSGVVVPGTGISLQNRGAGFSLEPGHPNQVSGGRRPFHTIVPAFLTRGSQAVMGFGVMGGDMQPQGHVQLMVRLLDHGQNPQSAADAPRWKIAADGSLLLESSIPDATATGLAARGHRVVRMPPDSLDFGAAQLVYRLQNGYLAASEPRRDGQAAGF